MVEGLEWPSCLSFSRVGGLISPFKHFMMGALERRCSHVPPNMNIAPPLKVKGLRTPWTCEKNVIKKNHGLENWTAKES